MWKNHLIIAYRNLRKNKVFSIINIVGLAIAMAAGLLILKYVTFELSYDDFRKPSVYRVVDYAYLNGEMVGKRAQTVPALAPALLREIPEVKNSARLVHSGPLMSDPVMQVDARSFHEDKVYYADAAFLDLFSYKMVHGYQDQALTQPNNVVISMEMADKYFPGQDGLGKELTFYMGDRGNTQLKVSGIFENIPDNSHVHTDFIISFNSIPWNLDDNWDWGNFYNYVELTPQSNLAVVEGKFLDVMEKYLGESLTEWRNSGYTSTLNLQPIQDIHLDSHLEAEAEPNGSRNMVRFLTLIAIFILIIAWINYVNLTIAKSVERAKEMGIRKVVGSSKGQLIAQFMTGSFLLNGLAAILAIAISHLMMPIFQNLTKVGFSPTPSTALSIGVAALFLTGTILSGLYPAYIMSSFQPLQMIKGHLKNPSQGVPIRKALIVFQFAASIALIAGTLGVRQQLSFMKEQDKGLNMEQTLIVKGPGIKDSTYQQHLVFFKNEVSKLPHIQDASVSSSIPGKELSWARQFYHPAQPESGKGINIIAIDEDFFQLYGADFLAGRNFSREVTSDRGNLILNETAMRQLGFKNAEEATQKTIIWHESDEDKHAKTIIGVIRDFNQESLHKEVVPMVFALKEYLNAPWAGEYYSLKIRSHDYTTALSEIKLIWEKAFPNSPFEYFFLDDYFNNQYLSEQNFARIFSLFAGLAILIACLGLFGLASYMTIQRTKEIGIRKVLGASMIHIITLLSKDFFLLIAAASVMTLPLVYFILKSWLQNYAYQMDIHWRILLLPILLVFLVAFFTVTLQTVKTALENPVKSLRSE
ncbi:ABC transporter permease [Cyclobacterium sp.]|uniref:ABC transporter permease n=1 Tax=Cyclobacterium sp. TaxID=1966343 RepID=UPI00199901AA|nr:ABC transporter permease [Cyclobacterium sp.]MBD3628452.1 ABC transporter permease [Cyclobacterium sp.]